MSEFEHAVEQELRRAASDLPVGAGDVGPILSAGARRPRPPNPESTRPVWRRSQFSP